MKRLINLMLILSAVVMWGCNDAEESSVKGGNDPQEVTSENLAGKWQAFKFYDSESDSWITDYGKESQYFYQLTMKEAGTYEVDGKEHGINYSYSGVYTINKSVLTLYISSSGEMELIMEARVESLTGSELVLRESFEDETHTLLYLRRK